jgi:DNA polymerase elongation subunit (family B)
MPNSHVVFLDVENSPSLGYVWGKYDQNVIDFKNDWFMLSIAYKSLGEKTTHFKGLIDYPGFKKSKDNDRQLMLDIWKILDGADIVVGHNVDKFDIRKINARFLIHGIQPPSPFKTVDTLKIARKAFKFNSNSLDDLAHSLGVGRKLKHIGFPLWLGCMAGDEASWATMKKYNIKDVDLLEKVYLAMRPWATNHANVNQGHFACPKCGSTNTQKRGFSYTLLRQKQRYQCLGCKGWWETAAKKVE